jgi:uncharacterized pyridoxal phosphate-containing UPF0001 family protein
MPVNKTAYQQIVKELAENDVRLIAVSKIKPVADIRELYDLGQRDFGENYVQELVEKQPQLPVDVRWHYIGHLQSNKVKYIAPFVHLIHGVDSFKLLKEINKQAEKNERKIDCLLQVHIRIVGLMGMGSFSDDMNIVRNEFKLLKTLFDKINVQYSMLNFQFSILSMGMSGDYTIAIEEGSTMVRVGSLLFGNRV